MHSIVIWFKHVHSCINVCLVARMMLKLKGKANDNALIKMFERYYRINSARDLSIILTHIEDLTLCSCFIDFIKRVGEKR